MIRKIIKQGHNTMTITLPSKWVKRFNLNGGSEVDVIERDNGLFITTEKNGTHRKAEFDITGMDNPTIWKYMMAVYREGYDEVIVKFNPLMRLESPYKFFSQYKLDKKYGRETEKKAPLEFLHDLVNRFIGFEIIDHGKDFVVIKEISESTSKEFENSLRRVFLLVQQMAEETTNALETNDAKGLSHIHDVDINLDKFHDYCIRILNKAGNKDPRKTSLLFSTLYLLEMIGDEFKVISHHLLFDFPKKDFRNLIELAESVKRQIDLFYEAFYKFDVNKINEISNIDKTRYFAVSKMYKKTKTEHEKEIFHHLRMIAKYINALLELRIEMEF